LYAHSIPPNENDRRDRQAEVRTLSNGCRRDRGLFETIYCNVSNIQSLSQIQQESSESTASNACLICWLELIAAEVGLAALRRSDEQQTSFGSLRQEQRHRFCVCLVCSCRSVCSVCSICIGNTVLPLEFLDARSARQQLGMTVIL